MKAMWERMGYSNTVATAIETAFGYTSLDEVCELISEEDAASMLVKTIRRWEDSTGNKPYQVTMRAEINTARMLFFLAHMERTSRSVTPADITVANVKSLDFQRQVEKDHDSSAVEVPKIDDGDWSKTLEGMVDYLNQHRGITGAPLGYVVRSVITVKAEADDPRKGKTGSEYENDDQEMIARAPILTATANSSGRETEELEALGPFAESFEADSLKVYNLLLPVFQKHSSLAYFKGTKGKKSSKNGRKAFRAVWDHYLGEQMVDHLSGKWEKELMGLKYMGEGRNGNFEQFCTRHKNLHSKLENLKQYGYQGIDERTKVRYFLQGLVHSSMENCKLNIQGRPECRQDYDKSVQVCRDFIESQTSAGDKSLTIAAVASGSEGMSIEDQQLARWYDLDEWLTFSKDKQEKILRLRKAKGGGKSDEKKAHRKAKRKIAKLKKSNSKLVKKNENLRKQVKVAALAQKGDDTDSSGSSEGEDDGFPSTRGQVKQKKNKKKKKKQS